MWDGAKPKHPIAPKRTKTSNDGHGSVVAEFRPNKDGTHCGPYYYCYRYVRGGRDKTYLPRPEGECKQRQLAEMREAWQALRQLLQDCGREDRRAEASRRNGSRGGRPDSPTGRYWHGSDLRDRRDFPTEERDRALFKYNADAIRADFGFAVGEEDYVEVLRQVRTELARRSQRGKVWENGMVVEVELANYPSWVAAEAAKGDPKENAGSG